MGFESIKSVIQKFESALPDGKEVGIDFEMHEKIRMIYLRRVEIIDSSAIAFFGINKNSDNLMLVQNISQMSFLLSAENRLYPALKLEPIGFCKHT